jgi:pyruvate/2-oxoglutarate dehydrogenase complex dihydrolipoamide acyltransferase (E2) component
LPTNELKMPKLGLTMEEGQVVTWLKRPGDRLKKGEPVVEVMTEKVNYDVECPFDGVLREIVVPEEETVPIGAVLAYVDAD